MKLQRLLGILAVLLQRKRISAEALAQRFEVSVRTIYRDLETLEQAGVPIVTYPGVNGGIEILDTYKLDKTVFLSEDFATILSGLQSISATMDSASLNRTLAKLRALIPEPQAERVELSGKKIYIDLKPWSIHPEFQPIFSRVKEGLEQNRLLRFSYTARENMPAKRIVEPHQLVLKEQSWYLRGFCREREDFRTFRLQRIQDVEVLDEGFVPRPFPDELDDFKDWGHPGKIIVDIIVQPSKKQAIMEFCRPEYLTDLPDGTIHVSLPFVESEIGYSVLLQMGHECKILGPEFVVNELKRRISLLAELYD